ncbi:flagellar hook capping FlgD N-terminal domain-containing protein [Sporolactobacillus kofuensis]|uniref:Flagellar hook capping FlgD N-terminal domain-containing protein n=1 Tax=Sporolactobacillus kofuensis TaxID=269672 RepID=A0ABW1WCT8_9BACL|nr:flagellar hook capping FlgD N-terminal domain-containing protein [Sporolactobacillus kofuensis]MCO7174694.1 flagellar hook capping protein [Sporolactobacillus kofuensis]
MSISASSGTSATTNTSTTSTNNANSALDKDSFLKLLVAQLTNQDPTSPMDSGQFVSQMADFTTLEQTQNMSNAIDKLVASQSNQSLSEQASMIGKQISWTDTATDSNGNSLTNILSGIVKSVTLKDGSVSYVTDHGESVDPSTITEVSNVTGASNGD